jgi:hypothetical protein
MRNRSHPNVILSEAKNLHLFFYRHSERSEELAVSQPAIEPTEISFQPAIAGQ